MIGQIKNRNYVDNLKSIPHFITFIGPKGSGKTLLSKYVADKLSATFTVVGIKVDEIREVIDTAYRVRDNVVYYIKDADNMRAEAKNAMLKITEEPPENAWFILSVIDESSLLATIKSRSVCIEIEPYSKEELKSYFWQKYNEGGDEVNVICDIATTPYEVDKLVEYGKDFIDFVALVLENIAEVESANAFKSSSKLALKTDEGYELKLFWEVFVNLCLQKISEDPLKYAEGICVTEPFLLKSTRLGVNKQQLYDKWVFDIRRVWI